MKSILLASTAALLVTAGVAAAEVTVTGEARMGILEGFDFNDSDDGDTILGVDTGLDTGDVGFTSRIRIKFAASGETDGGLTFGGSVRGDHFDNQDSDEGRAGSVFVSGAFGKISMGDVDGAAEAAVGDLSGVGLTGLDDYNELSYISNDGGSEDFFDQSDIFDFGDSVRPAALYEYTTGDLTLYVGADNPAGITNAYSVGAKYTMNTWTFSLGYENGDFDDITGVVITDGLDGLPGTADDVTTTTVSDGDASQLVAGVSAGFGPLTLKGVYGVIDAGFDQDIATTVGGVTTPSTNTIDADGKQWGLSADYVMGATTVTGFYRKVDLDDADLEVEAYGVGAAYDLGGGASLKGGVAHVKNETAGPDSDTAFDFGISMAF